MYTHTHTFTHTHTHTHTHTQIKVKLKSDNCDIAYPPVIQSGGKYDLKVRISHTLYTHLLLG